MSQTHPHYKTSLLEKQQVNKKNLQSWLLSAPSLIWLTVFFSIPYLIVIIYSLLVPDIYEVKFEFSLNAYREILRGAYFGPFILSFKLALITTLLCLLLGYPVAYLIARSSEEYPVGVDNNSFLDEFYHPHIFLAHLLFHQWSDERSADGAEPDIRSAGGNPHGLGSNHCHGLCLFAVYDFTFIQRD
jgi:hypothetical protein